MKNAKQAQNNTQHFGAKPFVFIKSQTPKIMGKRRKPVVLPLDMIERQKSKL